MPRVLVIDDEAPLRESLAYTFAREGFEVLTADDGARGLDLVRTNPPDAVVLDLLLPGIDGLTVCERIRAFSDVPVVMLTARDQSAHKLRGFEVGADDYVTKPFNTRELVARVRAAMRRSVRAAEILEQDRALLARIEEAAGRAAPPAEVAGTRAHGVLSGAGMVLAIERNEVTVDGRTVTLSRAEARLLEALMRERGRVVTRSDLVAALGVGDAPYSFATLEGLVRTLRAKVEPDAARPVRIVGVPGIGYQLN